MDEHILEFITESFDDGFVEYIEPVNETYADFQDEVFLLDDDTVLISDDDAISNTEDNVSEDILKSVDEVVSSAEVQSALPLDVGSGNGNTYNIYNITLNQQEDISEVPQEERIQEEAPEAVTEAEYSIDDIYSKLDGLASDVSVIKSNNYNHSQNMEKIGLTVVGLCVALLGGLVAYSVFNHIRP